MVQINFAQKSVTVKIVYYGPGMSGKTTNLEIVHQRAPDSSRGDLTSISTDGDRTLFFDFMPLDLGTVAGMRTQFQIYTVPGQVYYNSTRKLVLQGVDGVIFVADSSANMMEENLESLRNLEENLAEYGKDIAETAVIIQYNKRDLPDALPVAELEAKLNPWGHPSFEAVANSGQGVFPTLKALAARVLESIHDRTGAPTTPALGGGPQPATPPTNSPAPSAPAAPSIPAGSGPPAPFPAQPEAPSAQPQSTNPPNEGSPFPQPSPLGSTPAPFPSPPQAPTQTPMPSPVSSNSVGSNQSAGRAPQNPFPVQPPMGQGQSQSGAPGMNAPQGQGHTAPQPPQTHQNPPTASGPPTGGLTMGAPLPPGGLSMAQPNAPAHPFPQHGQQGQPGLGQTGMQPMYQPTQQPQPGHPGMPHQPPGQPHGQPGAMHPSLSQTGIRPMPGYGAPGAAPSPFPPVAQNQMQSPTGMPQAAPRPVPQSTRLKPRSQTVTITPAETKSGKGKWVLLSLLLLGAAGAGAAYFLELI